jgi:hypothetical protein
MTASVVLELAAEALRWTASRTAAQGANTLTIFALHESFTGLTFAVGVALGASILAGSLAMLLSGEFPRWVSMFGLAAGAIFIGYAFDGALTGALPNVGGIPWLAWVTWLLTTAVILFRRAGLVFPAD